MFHLTFHSGETFAHWREEAVAFCRRVNTSWVKRHQPQAGVRYIDTSKKKRTTLGWSGSAIAATAIGFAVLCTGGAIAVLHHSSQQRDTIKPGSSVDNPMDLLAQQEICKQQGDKSRAAEIEQDMTAIASLYKESGFSKRKGKDLGAKEMDKTRLDRLIRLYSGKYVTIKVAASKALLGGQTVGVVDGDDNRRTFLFQGDHVGQFAIVAIWQEEIGNWGKNHLVPAGAGKEKGTPYTYQFIIGFFGKAAKYVSMRLELKSPNLNGSRAHLVT